MIERSSENRRSRMTRRIFQETLLDILEEKPIEKITIKELCQRADMNRTTFYLHYNDQYDLLHDILINLKNDMLDFAALVRSKQTAEKRIQALSVYYDYIRNNARIFRSLFHISDNRYILDLFNETVSKSVSNYLSEFEDIPEKKYLINYLSFGVYGLIRQWVENDFDLPVSVFADLVFRTANAVSTSEVAHFTQKPQ